MLKSSEDSNYPATNAAVGLSAQAWRASSAGADEWLGNTFASNAQPTWCSIHGHNFDSGVTALKVQHDGSGPTFPSPTTEETVNFSSIKSPTQFIEISNPNNQDNWRVLIEGTNGSAPIIGELVFGIAQTLTRAQLIEWEYDEIMPQDRVRNDLVPQVTATNLSDHRQRILRLDFVAINYTQRDELRAWWEDTNFGQEPIWILPDESDELCIQGRLPNQLTWTRVPGPSGGYHRTSIEIIEDPFYIALP